ncbi:recombinase family protein [Salinibacterium sp. NSLL150]|uniref:recombinase family protein n=1 Tax=unclassified Salinibacterium TaxID=2632331 RepID=UPI0018CFC4D2|nr:MULTISPECIES: recombinase family protein [unclassified Salinibacterium]MBH0098686.1 recombinase family protein [Salinibacterium sp. NSLL35]MBH0101441.1 recombinase family protein [Salinibacterium sp. NSLL150]MBH0104200.1 recombinase family protein [Salinibacterium sp. NSLL16]MBH0106961.1 recombinase family protein [Salinibacterium sp. NSLL17]
MSEVRAAIYLRISRDDLDTGLAVERQREDCLRIVTERGWNLIAEPYVDNAISASKRKVSRPAYDRMREDFEAGAFDALVCYDLDRLTRQPRQLEDWIDAAEERGLLLVTANGEADLTTDNGRLFARIKASVARAEIERKGARQKRANIQRIESGRPAPGRRRYGYEPDGTTPRESEAVHVRRMFEHVAAGGSIRSIAMMLREEGVDPAPGKQWGAGRVRYILNNPSYGGKVHRFGEAVDSSQITPIVPAELAEEVRAILADEARRTTPGPAVRYLGSSLAHCAICDATMMNLAGGYRCRESASHAFINKESLDSRIREEVALAFLSSGRDLVASGESGSVAPLVAALRKNSAAALATAEDRDEGLLSKADARTRLVELRIERESIEAKLDAARAERSSSSSLADVAREVLGDEPRAVLPKDFFGPMLDAVVERFAALDIEKQRDTARALIDVTVEKGRDNRRRIHIWHKLATHLNPDLVGPGE